jgi:hypothetical protein
VALQLAIHVEAIGRPIDVAILGIHPRSVEEAMQILSRGDFLANRDIHPSQNNCRSLHDDRLTVNDSDHFGHGHCCQSSAREKKTHENQDFFHLLFVVRRNSERPREDRGLV